MLSSVNAAGGLYYGPHTALDHKILFQPLVNEIANLNIQSLSQKEMNFDALRLSESLTSLSESKDQHETSDTVEKEHEEHVHDTTDLDVCFLLFLMMIVGGFMKDIASYIKLPYTSLITVGGVILGVLNVNYRDSMGRIGVAVDAYSDIPPHFLLLVFLPALIFESAFNSDWHIFKA